MCIHFCRLTHGALELQLRRIPTLTSQTHLEDLNEYLEPCVFYLDNAPLCKTTWNKNYPSTKRGLVEWIYRNEEDFTIYDNVGKNLWLNITQGR